ncbi:hypothetical protein [Duncaniella muris]|nr:hypothetical protein [Duncaniella muris]
MTSTQYGGHSARPFNKGGRNDRHYTLRIKTPDKPTDTGLLIYAG